MSSGLRVLSVGVGTFLIAAVAILWLLMCVLGRILRQAWYVPLRPRARWPSLRRCTSFVLDRRRRMYAAGGGLMLVTVLVLALSPRASPSGSAAASANAAPIYTTFYIGLTLFALLISLSAAAVCVAQAVFGLTAPRTAKVVD